MTGDTTLAGYLSAGATERGLIGPHFIDYGGNRVQG
jgi:hypothetical protein